MAKEPKTSEETAAKAAAKELKIIQKSKLTLTTFKPKRIAAEKDETHKLFLGTLIGKATGVVQRIMPNEEKFTGLAGMFEAHVSNEDEPVRAGLLFMPDSFMVELIDALSDEVDSKSGEVLRPAANSVSIAYKVYCIRDGNPQGYSWQLEAILDPSVEAPTDPLAKMRGLVNHKSDQKLIA